MAFLKNNTSKKSGKANAPASGLPSEKNRKGGGKLSGLFSGGGHKFHARSGTSYSLVIGDEGAILCYIDGAEVKSRNFIASPSEENLKDFAAILAKDSDAPLYAIIDSMDQSFVQQTLPPISSMGVDKMIKRRLDRDFGKDVIKGYVLLDRETTGRKDWNFLMVALEKSANILSWLEFIEKIDNRLAGIYLLSVEVEYIIKALDAIIQEPIKRTEKKSKKEKKNEPQRWKLFISNNKVGGVRQVVLKNGKIIFTRLTQNIGDLSAAVIAGNIEQEVSSTIEYMKRLSFSPQQGLDIYVIASDEINNVLDLAKSQASNIYKFSPFEISELLGVTGAAQQADQFGDVILSVVVAASRKHRLRLTIPSAQKIEFIHKVILYEKAATGIAIMVMLGYGGMEALELWQKYSSVEDLQQQKASQQRRLDSLKEEVSSSKLDIKKISEVNIIYKQLISENSYPTDAIFRLRGAIVSSVVIKDVAWSLNLGTKDAPIPLGKYKEQIILTIKFPVESGTDEGLAIVAKKVLRDLQDALPEYDVSYSKLPEILQKKDEAGNLGFGAEDTKPKPIDPSKLEASLTILQKEAKEFSAPSVIGDNAVGSYPAVAAPDTNSSPDVGAGIMPRNSRLDVLRKERQP